MSDIWYLNLQSIFPNIAQVSGNVCLWYLLCWSGEELSQWQHKRPPELRLSDSQLILCFCMNICKQLDCFRQVYEDIMRLLAVLFLVVISTAPAGNCLLTCFLCLEAARKMQYTQTLWTNKRNKFVNMDSKCSNMISKKKRPLSNKMLLLTCCLFQRVAPQSLWCSPLRPAPAMWRWSPRNPSAWGPSHCACDWPLSSAGSARSSCSRTALSTSTSWMCGASWTEGRRAAAFGFLTPQESHSVTKHSV